MTNTPRTILIATSNPGKLREIQALVADLPVRWIGPADLEPLPEPVEDGDTFEANAKKKARHYARLTGYWTLADDSGLEVDALDNAPGVHSARYAGSRDDQANNAKLIRRLGGVPAQRRTAHFVCVMVLASPHRVLAVTRGTIAGRIIDTPRGENGFGYDPHFWLPDVQKTTAELTPEHKNRISHRGQAMLAMARCIGELLTDATT